MIRNYFKIAMRQLRKQRMYSVIKIGGFAFSIAACLLIALYIRNELSYDRSYPDTPQIYRVYSEFDDNGTANKSTDWPAPMGKALKNDFPEIEIAGRLMPGSLMGAGSSEMRRADHVENTYEEGITYADQQMLDILKLPMAYGDRSKALASPLSMVISRRKADKYFPGQNPVGKVMYLNNDKSQPYTVGGVMENIPQTSHLHKFDFFLTLSGKEFGKGEQERWDWYNYPVYVLVKTGTNIPALEKKITKNTMAKYFLPLMLREGTKDAEKLAPKLKIRLQPVSDINLYSYDIWDETPHGDIRFIWLFGAVAGFILVIACINFINLSTAKSANRAKEVGLRKVVGSYRSSIINQFLVESLLYSFCSFAVGILLAWVLLPYFNRIAGKSLTIPLGEWWLFPTMAISAIVIGVTAGLYPAVYLSGFKPVQVLKGTLATGAKSSVLRNSLVVFQFTTSIILIISTVIIYNQTQYILNKEVGFDKDQVIVLQGTNTLGNSIKDFKNELSKLASVKSVSISDYLPVDGGKRDGNMFYIDGRSKLDAGLSGQSWVIDDTYLKTMGIKLLDGRNFSYNMANDTLYAGSVIINQTMAKKLNLKSPVGKKITNGATFTIIGVVKDFNFDNMHGGIEPLLFHLGISPSMMTIKVKAADMNNTLQSVTKTWKSFAPDQPIRYTFLDETFANMYADVQRTGNIFTTFAILAIVIACLGLFALSAFMAEQRSREIGIRKVLGASVRGITTLLSMDFVKLVFIAIIIASPISWWAMTKWLQDFAYKVPITCWVFVLAGLGAIFIALVTVSFQSIKAALMNPVKSLKAE